MTRIFIADIEADGLLRDTLIKGKIVPAATHIHCMVISELNSEDYEVYLEEDIEDIKYRLSTLPVLVGHNFFGYDLPLLTKLYGFKWNYSSLGGNKAKIIDTLRMSQGTFPDRPGGHGLDAWGKRVGFAKPKVTDWSNQPIETYIHRCKEDVKINKLTYKYLLQELKKYD